MFILSKLNYPYTAYEPYFDAQTMEIHHTKHHAAYVKKLNHALVDYDINTERIEDLFEKMSELPLTIRQNAGGHYNHLVFWSLLDPGMTTPSDELNFVIEETFGLMEDLKAEFTKQALGVFGSGWTWLVINQDNELKIVSTGQQDNPLMNDINLGYPLLGIDLWEHAYYLKYQNDRLQYINAFWSLINWSEVSRRFKDRIEMNQIHEQS